MIYKAWHGFCLCGEDGAFPPEAVPAEEPFCPLVFLVRRDGRKSRGLFSISRLEELYESEGMNCLRPCAACLPEDVPVGLAALVEENGATVLNTVFDRAFPLVLHWSQRRNRGFRVAIVGLGDVGGTLLTGLILLGREIEEIAIYDPNEALCARYEMEMNQILPPENVSLPRVRIVGRTPCSAATCWPLPPLGAFPVRTVGRGTSVWPNGRPTGPSLLPMPNRPGRQTFKECSAKSLTRWTYWPGRCFSGATRHPTGRSTLRDFFPSRSRASVWESWLPVPPISPVQRDVPLSTGAFTVPMAWGWSSQTIGVTSMTPLYRSV